jgi:hypothetical protein
MPRDPADALQAAREIDLWRGTLISAELVGLDGDLPQRDQDQVERQASRAGIVLAA